MPAGRPARPLSPGGLWRRGFDRASIAMPLRLREVRVGARLAERQGEARLVADRAEAGFEVRRAWRRHAEHGGGIAAEVAEAFALEVELAASLLLELREHRRVVGGPGVWRLAVRGTPRRDQREHRAGAARLRGDVVGLQT